MHFDAARDYARINCRQSAPEIAGRIQIAPDWKSARQENFDGTDDRQGRGRHGAGFDSETERRRRRSSLRRRTNGSAGRLLHETMSCEREAKLQDRAGGNIWAAALLADLSRFR